MKTLILFFAFSLALFGQGQVGGNITQPSSGSGGGPPSGAAGGGLTGTYPNPGISSGSATAATCAGSPGNTTGAYKSQCQATTSGNFYTCNNAAGCTVAADWLLVGPSASSGGNVTGPNSSTNGDLACFNGVTGAVLSDCGILGTNVVTLAGTQTLSNKSGVTQSFGDNTTALATDAFVQSATAANGIAIPAALAKFRAALAKAPSSVVRVKIFGDSISICSQAASNPVCTVGPVDPNSLWPNALRNAFTQMGYPSHGTGVVPIIRQVGSGGNQGIYTITGATSVSTLIGPQQTQTSDSGGSLMLASSGAVISIASQTYDHLLVYCAEYTDSTAGFTVAIDGTNVGTACGATQSTATALVQSFAAGTGLGAHTATLTAGSNAYLYATEGIIGTTGVSVDNYSAGGAESAFFAGNFQFSDLATGDALAIISLGTNDTVYSISPATYAANISAIVSHEQSNLASTMLLSEPPMNNSGQASILSSALGVANSTQSAYLSNIDYWPPYVAAQSGAEGLYGGDNLHPVDAGALITSSIVATAVLGKAATSISSASTLSLSISPTSSTSAQIALYTPQAAGNSMIRALTGSRNWGFGAAGTGGYAGLFAGSWFVYDANAGTARFQILPSSQIQITSAFADGDAPVAINNSSSTGIAGFNLAGGRRFMMGAGEASESTWGVANKWFVYDYTASGLRAYIDSTGFLTLPVGLIAGAVTGTGSAPTISNTTGTVAIATTSPNTGATALAGEIVSSTTGTVLFTMTFPTAAPHRWNCNMRDESTITDVIGSMQSTAPTTTTLTIGGTTQSGDIISYACVNH